MLRRDDPDRFARIREMRPGRRALGGVAASVVAARQAWYWCFWSADRAGALQQFDVQQGLDQLYRHTQDPAAGGTAMTGLGLELMEAASAAFAPIAARVAAQQLEPRLAGEELFVLEQLERAAPSMPANRRALLEEMIAWVRSGRAQAQLRRAARVWKREKISAPAIADEVRVLFARFPPREVEVGEPEIVATILSTDR